MSLSVEQVTQLVQQLYGASAEETRRADAALKTWQASEGAWEVALGGLTVAQSDAVRYFFAQTLRSKVQLDFYQVSASPAPALALKQQLLVETFTKSHSSATLTQLLLSLADLAVQLDELWPDALGELIAASGERVEVLLDVLRLLPEELENERMVVDQAKRDSCRSRVRGRFSDVHNFFQTVLQSPSIPTSTISKLFTAFLAWLRLAVPSEADLASSAVFRRILADLPNDLALDVVLEVLNSNTQQPTLYPRLVREAILPRLVQLDVSVQPTAAEPEELVKVSRVLTLCAGSLMEAGVLAAATTTETPSGASSGNQLDPVVLQLLKKLTLLVAWHPEEADEEAALDVNLGPLEIFQDLALDCPAHLQGGGGQTMVGAVFPEVLDAVIRRLSAAPASEATAAVRPQALATARALVRALGVDTAGRKLLEAFGASFGTNADANEAIGSVLVEAIDAGFRFGPDALSEVVQVLLKVVQQTAGGTRPRLTCLRLLASLGPELPLSRSGTTAGLFERALEAVSSLLVRGCAPDEEVEAARTLRTLVSSQKEEIAGERPDYIASLCGVLKANKVKSSSAQTLLVEAVISVLNLVKDDSFFCAQLADALEPLLKRIAAPAADVRQELDQITAICRTLRVRPPRRSAPSEGARAEFFGRVIAPVLWQSVEGALVGSRGDEAAVEKTCRVVKHFVRVDRDAVAFLVPGICQRVLTEFTTNPTFSSYLYVAEILADAYGADDATPEALAQLFDRMTQLALNSVVLAGSSGEGLPGDEGRELVAEDLFGMASRFLRYARAVVLRSPHFGPLLAAAVKILPAIRRRETFDAVVSFLASVFDAASGGALAVVQEALGPVLGAAVGVVREGAGEDLLVLVATLFESVGKFVGQPQQFATLLALALDRELPAGVLTTANERNAAVTDLTGESHGRCVRRLVELGRRCNQRLRRR